MKHLILDVRNIRNLELLGSPEKLRQLMIDICEENGFTILQKTHHVFEPQGITMLFLLSESHFSIHTYPEHAYASIDLFTCRSYETNDDYNKIVKRIQSAFLSSDDSVLIVDRNFSPVMSTS